MTNNDIHDDYINHNDKNNNRYLTPLLISCLFLLIQQCLVALSTYFIAQLADDIANQISFIPSLIGFILSLLVVYVPAYFAAVFLEKAKLLAFVDYIKQFSANFYQQTPLYHQKNLKDERLSFVRQESRMVISQTLDYLFDSLALIANIGFNILVLSLVIDDKMIVPYMVGLLLASAFVFYRKPLISKYAKLAQKSHIQSLNITGKIWDNIVIGNDYNYSLFAKQLQHKLQKERFWHIKNTSINQLTSMIGMVFFMLPVLAFMVYLLINNRHDLSLLLVIVATLPRQLQLLQMGQTLIFYQTNFAAIKTKYLGLKNALIVPIVNYHHRICYNKIYANGQAIHQGYFNHLPICGRITITGDNGTGKSTLLTHLKQQIGKWAYYLPTQHELMFDYHGQYSTGQLLWRQLQTIAYDINNNRLANNRAIHVLLLDEWDANLDFMHTQQLDELLDELAMTLLVIEVRHGKVGDYCNQC